MIPEPRGQARLNRRLQGDPELARALTLAFIEELMAIEVDARCWSPTGERVNRRNGYRPAALRLPSGSLPLRVPRVRQGGYAPAWLAAVPDEAQLVGALGAACVDGVSDEHVDALVAAIGADDLTPPARALLADAMTARIDALHDRLLAGAAAAEANDPPRRAASILTRHHGRATSAVAAQVAVRHPRRRVPLLLAAVAAVALIAAVVIGTSAPERSSPDRPPATTVAPAPAPSTIAAPSPPASAAPSPASPVTTDCTTTGGGQRAPWMDEVLCEAARG